MKVSNFAMDDVDALVEIRDNDKKLVGELSVEYRPFIYEFLDDMMEKYELVLYSAFNSKYVTALRELLERRKKYFSYAFHDEFCLFANISYGVKCLNFLCGNRSPENIIIVDTKASSCPLHEDNYIPINAFEEKDASDRELVKLAALLDKISPVKDVRTIIRSYKDS